MFRVSIHNLVVLLSTLKYLVIFLLDRVSGYGQNGHREGAITALTRAGKLSVFKLR